MNMLSGVLMRQLRRPSADYIDGVEHGNGTGESDLNFIPVRQLSIETLA